MIFFCALFLATAERIERVDSAKMVILQNREARRQREIFLTLEYCIEQQQWYLIAIESMEGIALGSDNRGGSVACWFTSGDFVVIDLTLNNPILFGNIVKVIFVGYMTQETRLASG